MKPNKSNILFKKDILIRLKKLAMEKSMTLKMYKKYVRTTALVDDNIIEGRALFDMYFSLTEKDTLS